jgi:C-terminal processing protease CtpA/Prc
MLAQVDGRNVSQLNLPQISELIKGKEGSQVHLLMAREILLPDGAEQGKSVSEGTTEFLVKLRRKSIESQSVSGEMENKISSGANAVSTSSMVSPRLISSSSSTDSMESMTSVARCFCVP